MQNETENFGRAYLRFNSVDSIPEFKAHFESETFTHPKNGREYNIQVEWALFQHKFELTPRKPDRKAGTVFDTDVYKKFVEMKEREAENRLERDQAVSADGTSAADLFGDAGNVTGDVDSEDKKNSIKSPLVAYLMKKREKRKKDKLRERQRRRRKKREKELAEKRRKQAELKRKEEERQKRKERERAKRAARKEEDKSKEEEDAPVKIKSSRTRPPTIHRRGRGRKKSRPDRADESRVESKESKNRAESKKESSKQDSAAIPAERPSSSRRKRKRGRGNTSKASSSSASRGPQSSKNGSSGSRSRGRGSKKRGRGDKNSRGRGNRESKV